MKTESYHVLQYHELDDLITLTYGLTRPYEIVAFEELHNDSSWTVALEKAPLDQWQEEDMKQFRETGKILNWRTRTIMQDMVNRGILPEGNFLVEVSW
jgi:hypothetical protein